METSKTSILLVDDRADKLLAMKAILSDLCVSIVAVDSGREALDWTSRLEFAAILIDVRMPGLSGFETARRIREDPLNAHTPIIFVSAAENAELIEEGYALGAVDYIKDVIPQILRSKVSVFIDLHNRRKEITRQKLDLETLTRAHMAKDRFLAALSHELRTPLTPVLALLPELREREDASEEMRADLTMIERNVELEIRLISDLLDLTHVMTGTYTPAISLPCAEESLRASRGLVWADCEALERRHNRGPGHRSSCSISCRNSVSRRNMKTGGRRFKYPAGIYLATAAGFASHRWHRIPGT